MDPAVRHTDVSLGIKENRCVASPTGCGKEIDPEIEFDDEISRRDFEISGLCQSCQNALFNSEDEEDF